MKRLTVFLAGLLIFNYSGAQIKEEKGMYGFWGLSAYGSEKYKLSGGMTLGTGFLIRESGGLGLGFDVNIFSDGAKYAMPFADFRFFFDGSGGNVSPVFSFQPGHIIYSSDKRVGSMRVQTRGKPGFNALVGLMGRPHKDLGLFFQLGYSNIGFATNGTVARFGMIKVQLGISF